MNKKVPIIIAVILFVIGIILYFVFRETKQKEVKSDINYLVIGNESIWENKNNSWKKVTYDDVMEFLEDRTFPRNRADIADILNVLNLKKYDAYLMCKKLGGRTEQDNNWIDFLED